MTKTRDFNMDDCPDCEGYGDIVIGTDEDMNEITETCIHCKGTGIRKAKITKRFREEE